MHSLSQATKRKSLYVDGTGTAFQAASGVDGGAVNTQGVDTLGYAGLLLRFVRGAATNAHVLTHKLQGSTDAAFTSPVDLNTTVTETDVGGNHTNMAVEYEVVKPTYRYYRIAYQRTTQNSEISRVEAILFNPSHGAPTQDATAALGGIHTTIRFNGSTAA